MEIMTKSGSMRLLCFVLGFVGGSDPGSNSKFGDVGGLFEFGISGARAQQGEVDSAELVAKTANPLGGDFSLLLNQFDFVKLKGDGITGDQIVSTWSFQPVISIPVNDFLGADWIWVHRPTALFLPHANLPDAGRIGAAIQNRINVGFIPSGVGPPPGVSVPSSIQSGLGDFQYMTLFGQTLEDVSIGIDEGALVLAAGVTASFPTGSSFATSNQYTLGPNAAVAFIGKKYIFGALAQNYFDVASHGSANANGVTSTALQYFYYYNLPNGWQIGAQPIATLDWKNDVYSIPVGVGLYYTGPLFGKTPPIKLGVEFDYIVGNQSSFIGGDYSVRLNVTPIIPSLWTALTKPFKG